MQKRKVISFAKLRDLLLALPPVGDSGFEGLVANALSNFSGLTFRLAKSGSQFGRDATSTPAPFAIALEAKRYDDELRLEVLAGKAVVGGHVLEGKVDVWALGATVEVGEDVVVKLAEILERYSVTLLTLDWTNNPLPTLGVVLAANKISTLEWFKQHQPSADRNVLSRQLSAIQSKPSFSGQVTLLQQQVSAATVGLDALRRHCATWIRARLADPALATQTFGQDIAVAKAGNPAQSRPDLVSRLEQLTEARLDEFGVVAVLGEEGTGKTWLIGQWWWGQSEQPILIWIAGRRAENLMPADPQETLARLFAEQSTRSGEREISAWKRRLERWKGQDFTGFRRFVVVLDGINEQPTRPWADSIKALGRELQALGGILIVTSRTGFWERDVFPRIRGSVAVDKMEVRGYSEEELASVLARKNVVPADLPPKVLSFIRNPRVCALALNLIARHSILPNELTVDRLLMEYWQARLQERGDLIGHNVVDFQKLLRSHARSWLKSPDRPFDRDDWVDHSGAAKRIGFERLRDDLTEIEEGRFLQIREDQSSYEFRPNVLPYALGLLVNAELRVEWGDGRANFQEQLERILGAIRGFDRVAEIIASATGLACLDDTFPSEGRSSLIGAWLGLQNIDDDAREEMAAYLPACPDSFLDVLEWPETLTRGLTHHQYLSEVLLRKKDRPSVRSSLQRRVSRWLGQWTRQAQVIAGDEAQEKRQNDRETRIDSQLAALSDAEKAIFRKLTFETPERPGLLLDYSAVVLLAGQALAPFAEGLFGWALARSVAGDARDAAEPLGWVVCLNPVDWEETSEAVDKVLANINEASSEPMKRAGAHLLRLMGDADSTARAAELLEPPPPGETWRRIATFCDTNPHDPAAAPGSNLENARNAAASLRPEDIWTQLSVTLEDDNLEKITPALARFDAPIIVRLLRDVVGTAPARTGLHLRQLSFHLVSISSLFDHNCVTAVRNAFDTLLADASRAGTADANWIASALVCSLIPHVSAAEQLDLLLMLPKSCPLYLKLRDNVKCLAADELERRLVSASTESNAQDLARILFFASGAKAPLTPQARSTIATSFNSPDGLIAAAAADVIYMADDADLYDLVLASPITLLTYSNDHEQDLKRARAFAAAIIDRGRVELLAKVHPRLLASVAAGLGGPAFEATGGHIEQTINRLLMPVIAVPPKDISIYVGVSENGLDTQKFVKDRSDDITSGDLRSRLSDLNNPEAAVRRFSERQAQMIREMATYERTLTEEGAAEIFAALPRDAVNRLVAAEPNRVGEWMTKILGTKDEMTLERLRNFGLSLAGAYALHDPLTASRVFQHLRPRQSNVNIIIGDENIPLYEYALFSTPDLGPLDPIRREIFRLAPDDASIEMATLGAERCGADLWLTGYVDELVASSHPANQALGITIAGLRQPNASSDRIFATRGVRGFLENVRAAASKSYQRASWARYWLETACRADDPIDFWRYSRLAEGVCDLRLISVFHQMRSTPTLGRFRDALFDRLKNSAEERRGKRKSTLFGLKAPEQDILKLIRDPFA